MNSDSSKFLYGFYDEMEKMAGVGSWLANFAKTQAGLAGVGRYRHLLKPGEESLVDVAKRYVKAGPIRAFGHYTKEQGKWGVPMALAFAGMDLPNVVQAQSAEEKGKALGRIVGSTVGFLGIPFHRFVNLPLLFGAWPALTAAGGKIGGTFGRLFGGSSEQAAGGVSGSYL